MSSSAFAWPAFGGSAPSAPIRYERAVWGKVHGASSDFRFIARSAGFGPLERTWARHLSTGTEDRPHRAAYWRVLPEHYVAVSSYPSRATDAAGRGGHLLEKQILILPRRGGFPAVLGALLLLPHAASFGDDGWWPFRGDSRWESPNFALVLPPAEHEALDFGEEFLSDVIRRGLKSLRSSFSLDVLARIYSDLLGRRRPVWVRKLERPLSPEALAVLLLPLSRELADEVSLAGWIPSSRIDPEQMRERWDVIAEPQGRVFASESPASPEHQGLGRSMAEALWRGEARLVPGHGQQIQGSRTVTEETVSSSPQESKLLSPEPVPNPVPETFPPRPESARETPHSLELMRPGQRLGLERPPAGASAVLLKLHAFADLVDRRWLSRKELQSWGRTRPLRFGEPAAERVLRWVEEVERGRPDYAHEEQWAAKVELLRAVARTLVPTAPRTQDSVESRWVSPMYMKDLIDGYR